MGIFFSIAMGRESITRRAQLGKDEGQYGFRRWQSQHTPPAGKFSAMVRCTNAHGEVQPDVPNWNPSGFMRNLIEVTHAVAT